MNPICFNKVDWDTNKPFSTLDHNKNTNSNRGIQNDDFNCGVWALMEMLSRESGENSLFVSQCRYIQ